MNPDAIVRRTHSVEGVEVGRWALVAPRSRVRFSSLLVTHDEAEKARPGPARGSDDRSPGRRVSEREADGIAFMPVTLAEFAVDRVPWRTTWAYQRVQSF